MNARKYPGRADRRPWIPAAAWLALAAALLAPAAQVRAGSLGISPMRIEFTAERSITHVTVTNPTQETLAVELEAQPWLSDTPGPTRDLTVNPPTATLRPGAKLTVRIGLTKRLPSEREHAYRLYVTELPQPLGSDAQGISVRLRVGIPIFVAATAPQPEPLRWSLGRDERGTLLVAHNPGNVHERVFDLKLAAPGTPGLAVSGPSYVLAGARAEFLLPPGADPAQPLRVLGRTARAALDQALEPALVKTSAPDDALSVATR